MSDSTTTTTQINANTQTDGVNTQTNPEIDTEKNENSVQSGIFGGSAEAVDAMVNGEKEDSGETFNFDEIDFGKQGIVKSETEEEMIVPADKNKDLENNVSEKIEDVASSEVKEELENDEKIDEDTKNIIEENIEDNAEETVGIEEDVDVTVKEAAEEEPESSLKDLFYIIYKKLEHIYELHDLNVGEMFLLSDTNYSFVVKDFDVDTFDIHKSDTNITFSMDSGSLDVFVNQQHLFAEEDLLDNEEKMLEVKQKLEYFVDLVSQEEAKVEEEVASKKADEEKMKMFEHFKQF